MKISIHTIVIITLTSLLLCSCSHIAGSDYHLPPKTMQHLLLDINLAESYSILLKDSMHRPGTKNIDSLAVYYKDIFAHYNITEAEFEQTLTWYKNHPEELDTIYSNNVKIVKKWQDLQFKKAIPTPLKPDSTTPHTIPANRDISGTSAPRPVPFPMANVAARRDSMLRKRADTASKNSRFGKKVTSDRPQKYR